MPDGEGHLRIDSPGGTLELVGERGGFVLRANSMAELRALTSSGAGVTRGAGAGVSWVLHTARARIRVVVRGNEIARLGIGAAPGLLSRWLRWPDVELRPIALVRALFGWHGSQ